jgi:hypothetical protein
MEKIWSCRACSFELREGERHSSCGASHLFPNAAALNPHPQRWLPLAGLDTSSYLPLATDFERDHSKPEPDLTLFAVTNASCLLSSRLPTVAYVKA